MADAYNIAEDSPLERVTIDKKRLTVHGDAVELTAAEVKRVEAMGAKLKQAKSSTSNS